MEEFMDAYPENVGLLIQAARNVLLTRFPTLNEEPDFPSRILVYRIAPRSEGIVFTLIPSQKGLKLGFYRGRELADPTGLLKGSGKVHATTELSENLLHDQSLLDLMHRAMLNAQHRITRS